MKLWPVAGVPPVYHARLAQLERENKELHEKLNVVLSIVDGVERGGMLFSEAKNLASLLKAVVGGKR